MPELHRGPWQAGLIDRIAGGLDVSRQEGFVCRLASAFPEADMPRAMGKYVRAGHVTSEQHWRNAPLVPNRLA